MDFKGKRRFKISDDKSLLEENAEAATLIAATLVGNEEIQLPVIPENAYTEVADFQDLFHALDLPDIIDFEQRNQSTKNWN